MSKSRRNWLFSGALFVSAVLLVTSVAVGVGFRVHRSSGAAVAAAELAQQRRVHDGIAEAQYFVLSPLMIQGTVAQGAISTWGEPGAATPFPRIGDSVGQPGSVDVRNPGVRIGEGSTTGERRERRLQRASRRRSLEVLDSKNLETEVSPGFVSANSLASEINARRPEIGRCASQRSVAAGKVPAPAGKLALRWVVRTDGSSNDVEVTENTLSNPRFSKCVVETVGRWRFSPPTGGNAPVESTFMFL